VFIRFNIRPTPRAPVVSTHRQLFLTPMSSAAVLRRRGIELGDRLYLERSDRTSKFEDFLRGVV
jgi:hypothetical protein